MFFIGFWLAFLYVKYATAPTAWCFSQCTVLIVSDWQWNLNLKRKTRSALKFGQKNSKSFSNKELVNVQS